MTIGSGPPRQPLRSAGFWTVLAILVALSGALATAVPLLTKFSYWDDEGYVLISLAHYIKQGHLYTQTFSQYGPFYFYMQGLFFQLLHLPVTHEIGRLVTLVYWLVSSLFAAVFVYRLSRSVFLACAAGLCMMLTGSVLTNEPGHPQQVVLVLYMAAACLSLPSRSIPHDLRLLLLGFVGAALAFTKINIGVFYIAGLAHALVCVLPSGRLRSMGIGLTMVYAAAFPWLLMHASFDRGATGYCLLATACGVATFACGALVRPHPVLPARTALRAGAGLLLGALLIVAATSIQGMSIGSLVSGVILNPLHHPNVFYIPLRLNPSTLIGALMLTAYVAALRMAASRLPAGRWLDVLRCAAGIGAILLLTFHHRIEWVVPLLPLTLMPQSNSPAGAIGIFPRLFVTDMALSQFLEAYPVAGSQLGIAAAPMILWAFLCTADGIVGLQASSRKSSRDTAAGLPLDAAIGGAILVLFAAAAIIPALSAYRELPPASSGLKGSEWLHLPVEQTARFEAIASTVGTNCGILFSMPGLASFNIWSGVPTPNGWNLNAWMKGFPAERQNEILRLVKADANACAILNRRILRMWDDDDAALSAMPLARYITLDMPKAAEFGEYEIRVHPHRTSPWLSAGMQARSQ